MCGAATNGTGRSAADGVFAACMSVVFGVPTTVAAAAAAAAVTDITCESVSGTAKQETADGGEEEVETVGFRLNFKFRENPFFTNTVSY